MARLDARLLALESHLSTSAANGSTVAHQAAHGRIFDALCQALPEIREGYYNQITPFVRQWVATRTVSLEDLILPLDQRITAGTMTDADQVVLTSLPADDLAVIGMTAQGVIASFARGYRAVNE